MGVMGLTRTGGTRGMAVTGAAGNQIGRAGCRAVSTEQV
jgi:hypothetical protein